MRGNQEDAVRRYDRYAGATTVEAFYTAGGRRNDLMYDIRLGYATLGEGLAAARRAYEAA